MAQIKSQQIQLRIKTTFKAFYLTHIHVSNKIVFKITYTKKNNQETNSLTFVICELIKTYIVIYIIKLLNIITRYIPRYLYSTIKYY